MDGTLDHLSMSYMISPFLGCQPLVSPPPPSMFQCAREGKARRIGKPRRDARRCQEESSMMAFEMDAQSCW